GSEKLFRFEDLELWQRAADVSFALDELADRFEEQRRYRHAEQLRCAGLSISNNIAEGSGSKSSNEFRNFLNIAHRSAFECASMLLVFKRKQMMSADVVSPLLVELNEVCRMLTGLSRSLN
ncbi:MAG: four helix bundle protein, partial [Pirellulales bacterium]